jgi:O-antigen/teichoic acid export membrane protein
MNTKIKSILKDVSVYSFADVIGKGIQFLSVLIYTNFFSASEIGIFGYLSAYLLLFTNFSLLGSENAYSRFFFDHDNMEFKVRLTSTLFFFTCFISIVIFCLLITNVDSLNRILFSNSNNQIIIISIVILLPVRLISSFNGQILRNNLQTKTFSIYNVSVSILTLSFIYILHITTSLGIEILFFASVISEILILPFRLYSVKKFISLKFDRQLLKSCLVFSLPFVPAIIAQWFLNSFDRQLLKNYLDFETLGIYTIAASMGSVLSIFARSISLAWTPHVFKMYQNNSEEARIVYEKFFKIILLYCSIIIFLFSLFGYELIALFLNEIYLKSFLPFMGFLIIFTIQLSNQITAIGISIAKKSMYVLFVTVVGALTSLGLNVYLIPSFGIYGATLSAIISSSIVTLLFAYYSRNYFRINYSIKFILIFLFVAMGSFLIWKIAFWIKLFLALSLLFLFIKRNTLRNILT